MKNYSLKGVGQELQLGKRGPHAVAQGFDVIDFLDSDLNLRARIKAAAPIDAEDVVTLAHLQTALADASTVAVQAIADAQIETGAETGAYDGQIAVVTKSGLTGIFSLVGQLVKWDADASQWNPLDGFQDGFVLTVLDDIVGTDLSLSQGRVYVWETNAYVDNGPVTAEDNLYKNGSHNISQAVNNVANGQFGFDIPANSTLDSIIIRVDTAFDDPAAEIEIRDADSNVLMTVDQSDLSEVGIYEINLGRRLSPAYVSRLYYTMSAHAATVGSAAINTQFSRQ